MRLKHIKGSQERIESDIHTFQTDNTSGDDFRGKWNTDVFKNDNPIYIEIGMGKGKFISQMAAENPDINFIGIEKFSSVLVRALDRLYEIDGNESPITAPDNTRIPFHKNLILVRMDAENINKYFDKNEVSRIFLNFSDPWPKDRHAKRRLTSHFFLEKYKEILTDDGILQFKTDNKALFDFSIDELKAYGWSFLEVNYNLHSEGPAKDNIMTEYEEKFYALAKPICRLRAKYDLQ